MQTIRMGGQGGDTGRAPGSEPEAPRPEAAKEDDVTRQNEAKTGCPVSRALASVPEITLDASLEQ